ncbi:SMC family ATPase [Aeromicrobium sp. Marseille-Q0843]|uniref:Nuclease SbcCD subunit C n=1 Tax=Aeromicrobium phoceense TaxID=2754045 RepID=A0A838XIG9_9ACTN|nr:SMC family ATPase [Aeromicrobium phoceense]MBA4609667.1 SMC family ATPase [Aeromicrobium phoceense]
MRIHQVTMTGFGPFRDTQTVDLDAFADHGIFLITGRTGAGKSSILDAIVYALYDSAPRYAAAGGKQVRSTHCEPNDPTRVELVFSAAGRTYRVVRTPEYLRPKVRGTGMTPEKATAELSVRQGDEWVGLAAQPRTVGEELHEILPLRCDQFLQVVLLAQGQFQRFLVASSEERQRLLRTLFRSERFSDYDTELQRRAGELRQELRAAESGIASTISTLAQHAGQEAPAEADEAWIAQVLVAFDADVELAKADLDQATKEVEAAAELLQQATELAERQRRLASATEAMALVVEQAPRIAADRLRRDLAVAAQSVEVAHRARVSAAGRAEQATAGLVAAEARFAEAVDGPPPADLAAHRDALTADLAVLTARLADEQELERLRALSATLTEQLDDLALRADDLTVQCRHHDAVLEREIDVTPEQAGSALERLRAELDLARKRATAERHLAEAQLEELKCGKARTAASTALDSLNERRLAEYAGTLAQELVAGEACAVCGSAEHPVPAALADDHVTEDALDRAREAFDRADHLARRAGEQAAALRATVQGWAEVRPLDELTAAVTEAEAVLTRAEQAEQERVSSRAAKERIEAALADLSVQRATVEQRAVATDQQVAALATTVARVRGASGSVVERIAVVTGHVEATAQLIEARATERTARERLRECDETFATTLDHHGFADEDEFLETRLDASAIAELTRRIEGHEALRVASQTALAAPELQDLPAEPADVARPQEVHTQAREVCRVATERHGAAKESAATANRVAAAIRREWATHAEARASYEVLDRLARSLHGESPNTRRMRVESYVLAAELEQIVAAANLRLHAMSSGRYALERSDVTATRGSNSGLEVRVRDDYTGVTRSPESLSGGEKFLASLALALGLAEVVTNRAGGITLDTLFIDEGFGSLDAETLEVAMHTLDALRQNGRTIGLISHVETMKERIPAQLAVERTVDGWSRVQARA